ncbi:hypothetical protein [Paractinoplanes atraurantiacus]|uniref:RING-type E3 ubiquitin transferase n=1 Tax=Paractinoplanes atraurantiacus TaxID=1036182 RepID=A0A285KA10_9ACTN|nr:hypothetical protein [Actinoplanes atraurantiacus]SNY69464.1 hypothetical protein SAMN05421748_13552 [Actinoplanes atraurantiacus]
MATVAALVMFVGVGMVAVSGLFALFSVGDLRLRRLLRQTPRTPIGSWRPGRVAAEGVIECGPAGRQTALLSGSECAWYDVTATCYRAGDSDGDLTWRTDVGRTPAGPALADATARVPVDPGVFAGTATTETTTMEYVHKRHSVPPAWIPATMASRLKRGDSVTVRETRLPLGGPVFALGHLENGALVRRGRTVFAAGRYSDAVEANDGDLSLMTVTIPVFFLGGLIVAGGALAVLVAVTD